MITRYKNTIANQDLLKTHRFPEFCEGSSLTSDYILHDDKLGVFLFANEEDFASYGIGNDTVGYDKYEIAA